MGSGAILVDACGLILREYRKNLRHETAPGIGFAFLRWAHDGQGSAACRHVRITRRPGSDEDYEEFPSDPALSGFDRSDRKFVAVALASGEDPWIANALDSDWAVHHSVLLAHGVRVRFVCPSRCAPDAPAPAG